MYKLFVLAFVLFPYIASAHGAHAPVEASFLHGLLHSAEGIMGIAILGVVVIIVTVQKLKSVK